MGGHYVDPGLVVLCGFLAAFFGCGFMAIGAGVASSFASRGRKGMVDASGLVGGISVVIWTALVFVISVTVSPPNYLVILSLGLFGLPIGLAIGASYMRHHVPLRIAAADELYRLGGDALDLLDADVDRIISRRDIHFSRQNEQVKARLSPYLLKWLPEGLSVLGHNVGSEGSSCYVLVDSDIHASPRKIREKYCGWAENFVYPKTNA